MTPPIPIRWLADEKISQELKPPKRGTERYPHIESIRIIQKAGTPSATIKLRRRRRTTGGPSVVRTYQVYDVRWVILWQAAQVSLFTRSVHAARAESAR